MKASDRERAKQIIVEEYDLAARVWDRCFVPATTPARERLLELARLTPGESVLDIGTGTGAAALLAAQRVGEEGTVVGIDISGEMLEEARAKAARLGLGNVDFRRMDEVSLELPDRTFDAAISCFGAPPDGPSDNEAALIEFLRVLKPGGRLCLCDGAGKSEESVIFDRVFARYRVTDPSPELAARRRLEALAAEEAKGVPSDFSDASGAKRLIEAAGFRDVRVITETFENRIPSAQALLDYRLLWVSAEYAAMPKEVQNTFRRELLAAFRTLESRKGLGWAKVAFGLGRRAEE